MKPIEVDKHLTQVHPNRYREFYPNETEEERKLRYMETRVKVHESSL